MRTRIILWLLLFCVSTGMPALAESYEGAVRPNVLFFAIDDLRPTLGCYGDGVAKTPNIDRLAKRGVVFERAYCQQSLCNPSRASVMTGLRPDDIGVWDLKAHFRDKKPNVVTLPQCFKQQGYHSESIGKIYHGGGRPSHDPPSWSVKARRDNVRDPKLRYRMPGNLNGKGLKRNSTESADVADDAYIDGIVCEDACRTLDRLAKSKRPFFLAVGFRKPHLPFCAPSRYWDLYDPASLDEVDQANYPSLAPELATRAWQELAAYRDIASETPGGIPPAQRRRLRHGYYACVSYTDALIGKTLDQLERSDLADNTIVVLWGDHGFHLGELGLWTKCNNFELATRVPLIVHDPRDPAARGLRDSIVELVDVYPTLVDLCGLEPPANLAGESLAPLLCDGRRQTKNVAYSQMPRAAETSRHSGDGDYMGYAVRSDRYRYVEWRENATQEVVASELYDYHSSRSETKNVAASPESKPVMKEMAGLLQEVFGEPSQVISDDFLQSVKASKN